MVASRYSSEPIGGPTSRGFEVGVMSLGGGGDKARGEKSLGGGGDKARSLPLSCVGLLTLGTSVPN